MKLYAHSSEQPQDQWEQLEAHLLRVGHRAARLAGKFGAGDLGMAAGLLHDIGKAKPGFQAYLRKLQNSEPHSAEGALLAQKHYSRKCPRPFEAPFGRLLAFAIAGHHAGLANGAYEGGETRPLNVRLDDAEDVSGWFEPGPLPVFEKAPAPLLSAKTDPFAWAFFIRMLFSALVDADRLATEEWFNEASSVPGLRGWPGKIAELKQALDRHLEERFGGKSGSSDLARLREEVLQDCRAAASQPQGLFSLTVPTGGGKTLSSLAFALNHALHHDGKIERVIYVIPFTSIADQTADVFRKALGDADAILEHHSAFDDEKLKPWLEREEDIGLTKLRLAAQNWDRPIVVTTAVQFFESLFASSPGRCRKLHNIARSVVILDEAQTLPIKLLRPCLAALKELVRAYGTSVVLCTATQPAVTKKDFAKVAASRPPAEALDNVREIIQPGRDLHGRLKRVKAEIAGTLTNEQLIGALKGTGRALVIVNNRRHARELFASLKKAGAAGVRHLTTAMTAAHRQHVLGQIREDLTHGRPVRLVSTSLIEAGVDISFDAVWRAWAGLDQIVQAAGRCNRNCELGDYGGRLVVFSPEDREGQATPAELKQNAESARRVLREGMDPLSSEAVQGYFRELLWTRDDGGHWRQLDAAEVGESKHCGIMTAIDATKYGLNFPFADIARAFRMIEEVMVPVIIPASINKNAGAPNALVESIPYAKTVGGVARHLQRHIVQIPRKARLALVGAGSAFLIAPENFGEQFVLLANPDLYSDEAGLDWDDPTFRTALIW